MMVNGKIARGWLEQGKKIRKPYWKEDSYWVVGDLGLICFTDGTPAKVHLNQLKATDWIIYEETEIRKFTSEALFEELRRRRYGK